MKFEIEGKFIEVICPYERLHCKGPSPFGGQMGFLAGACNLIFCHGFLKKNWKIEKMIIFMGIKKISIGAWNKSYVQISLKQRTGGK